MRNVYMDNASTSYVGFANPSASHGPGQQSRRVLESARAQIAKCLCAHPSEISFTSGGTESDNWVIQRTVRPGDHIITSQIEHPAVLNACRYMESIGCGVTYLGVDSDGFVSVSDLQKAIRPNTKLVSVMTANNEIGTIQPIRALAHCAKERGILFHTDAVQAAGAIPLDVDYLGVDYLSVSGHKFGAQKGIGVLYMREGKQLPPLMFGGHQEHGLRPGTENVLGVVTLAEALMKCTRLQPHSDTARLRDLLISEILRCVPGAFLNGDASHRLPGNANFCFPGVESEALLARLSSFGIAASAGSACTTGSPEPSHVLLAIGLSPEQAASCIRFSLSDHNTEDDVYYAADCTVRAVREIRELYGWKEA